MWNGWTLVEMNKQVPIEKKVKGFMREGFSENYILIINSAYI